MTTTEQAEPADRPNHSTRAGAEVLADRMRKYWTGLGYVVAIRVEQVAAPGGGV